MVEMAKLIEVEHVLNGYRFAIDGVEFPWHITEQGVHVQVERLNTPAVTITIMADEVRVHHAPYLAEIDLKPGEVE